jgi:NAD(P)-dependent dehydrogenase (short-subunit alcohol dehydrogenase family)
MSDNLFEVSGRVVLITGAASGLGLAMAEIFAEHGARLALLDSDREPLERAHGNLGARGAQAMMAHVDVRNPSSLHHAMDAAVLEFGALDVVFANAGIAGGPGFLGLDGQRNAAGAIDAIAHELWDAVIGVNLSGVFATLQRAAFHMKRQQRGKIVVTTSMASFRNESWVGTPYMPAKAGAAHLVRQAALELARDNITVNAIAPGFFPTNLGRGRPRSEAWLASMVRRIPLGRTGTPSDIQGLALFLASAASDFITGAEIPIDGGAALGVAG